MVRMQAKTRFMCPRMRSDKDKCFLCFAFYPLLRPMTPLTSEMKETAWRTQELCKPPPCHVASGRFRKGKGSACAAKKAQQKRQVQKPTLRTSNTKNQVRCKEPAGVAKKSPLTATLSPRLHLPARLNGRGTSSASKKVDDVATEWRCKQP